MDTDKHGFGLSVFICVHPWLEKLLPHQLTQYGWEWLEMRLRQKIK
jgi:hypothetical protein